MNYATIKANDVANGTGIRVSLFVSGCTHYCKDCFNPDAWAFDFGTLYTQETEDYIINLLRPSHIRGLSLLGGEPFHPNNQAALVPLLQRIRKEFPAKTIWCYTGYLLEDILDGTVGDKATASTLLNNMDVLIDGKFEAEQKNLSLRFRGSENQRLLDVKKTLIAGMPVDFI